MARHTYTREEAARYMHVDPDGLREWLSGDGLLHWLNDKTGELVEAFEEPMKS